MPPAGDDDTELLTVVTPQRRPPATTLTLIGGAVLGLAVVAGIIVSVVTMSDESTRPVPQAPLTPISIPAAQHDGGAGTVGVRGRTRITAGPAATHHRDGADDNHRSGGVNERSGVRDRLHELFPRLFPENP